MIDALLAAALAAVFIFAAGYLVHLAVRLVQKDNGTDRDEYFDS